MNTPLREHRNKACLTLSFGPLSYRRRLRIVLHRIVSALRQHIALRETGLLGCNHRPQHPQRAGSRRDSFVFVAIERSTKLVLNVAIGKRDQGTTNAFMEAVRNAIAPGRFQITRDGFAPYKTAIPDTFGSRVDFAMSIKVYRAAAEGERKYSPAEVVCPRRW